jgi:hypothetical protein
VLAAISEDWWVAATGTVLTYLNPVLHKLFRDSYFTCDGSSTIQVSSLLFNKGGIFAIIKLFPNG